MGFLTDLVTAINERSQAQEFGQDFRQRRQGLSLENLARQAALAEARRKLGVQSARAASLYPGMETEAALGEEEAEKVRGEREGVDVQNLLRRAQAVRALREPVVKPFRKQKVWTGQGFEFLDPEELEGRSFPQEPSRAGAGGGDGDGALAANPILVTDKDGNTRLAGRVKGGGLRFIDEIEGEAVGAGPTSEQRNQERYDVMVPTQIKTIRTALQTMKAATGGSWMGAVSAAVPTTRAYRATQGYTRLLEGLAATTARAMGDTRISDIDRRTYASMYGVVSQLASTPPGTELAEDLLNQAEQLTKDLGEARRAARTPGGPDQLPVGDEDLAFERNVSGAGAGERKQLGGRWFVKRNGRWVPEE